MPKKPASLVLGSAKAEVVPGGAGFVFCPHPKLGELTAAWLLWSLCTSDGCRMCPGSWQAPEHPLLESQRGFGGKSGVTRLSLVSCPCSEEPILTGPALGMGAASSAFVHTSHPKDLYRSKGRGWTQISFSPSCSSPVQSPDPHGCFWYPACPAPQLPPQQDAQCPAASQVAFCSSQAKVELVSLQAAKPLGTVVNFSSYKAFFVVVCFCCCFFLNSM